jgi:hypothetical protein
MKHICGGSPQCIELLTLTWVNTVGTMNIPKDIHLTTHLRALAPLIFANITNGRKSSSNRLEQNTCCLTRNRVEKGGVEPTVEGKRGGKKAGEGGVYTEFIRS